MHQERSDHAASHDTGKELYETVHTVFTGLLDSEDLIYVYAFGAGATHFGSFTGQGHTIWYRVKKSNI
jgi:hypothetical protein